MSSPQSQKNVLKRLTVISSVCFCPLYDQIYSWQSEDKLPSTSAKLISLFTNVASTFGDKDGGSRRVIFDQIGDQNRKVNSHFTTFSSGLPNLGNRTTTSSAASGGSRFMMSTNTSQNSVQMELIFTPPQNKCIIVGVYLKPGSYVSDLFEASIASSLADAFFDKYGRILQSLESQFKEMSSDQEAARNNTSLMSFFKDWTPDLNEDYITEEGTQRENYQLSLGAKALPLSTDLMNDWARSHKEGEAAISQLVPSHFEPTKLRQNAVEHQYNNNNVHYARRALQQHVSPPDSDLQQPTGIQLQRPVPNNDAKSTNISNNDELHSHHNDVVATGKDHLVVEMTPSSSQQ